ncbi:hypothetical protein BDW62DRAFT_192231 [Aspergillus aurantiobrunneus]
MTSSPSFTSFYGQSYQTIPTIPQRQAGFESAVMATGTNWQPASLLTWVEITSRTFWRNFLLNFALSSILLSVFTRYYFP